MMIRPGNQTELLLMSHYSCRACSSGHPGEIDHCFTSRRRRFLGDNKLTLTNTTIILYSDYRGIGASDRNVVHTEIYSGISKPRAVIEKTRLDYLNM